MNTNANYIECVPSVMMGKPVLKGTRVTVESILERLAGGENYDDIIASHPLITMDHIRAVMNFAAESLKSEVVYPIREMA